VFVSFSHGERLVFHRLEAKVRDYIQLLNELPARLHSLNVQHLSLSNDLRANLLNWPAEQFARLDSLDNVVDVPSESASSPTIDTLEAITSETPPTPLTSLKQLLGIRTQDTVQLEPSTNSDVSSQDDVQR
jgi:hypothetical protein